MKRGLLTFDTVKRFIRNHIDSSHRWIAPICAFFVVVYGLFPTSYFEWMKKHYPNWHHQLDWIKSLSFWVFIFCSIYELIQRILYNWLCKPTIQELEKKLNGQEAKITSIAEKLGELFFCLIAIFADNKLNFKTSERISLYFYNGENLNLIARYSKNQKFRPQGRRSIYPIDQGCIGKAWENGWHFDSKFPCSEKYTEKYVSRHHNKYNIPNETVHNLKMKSRSYAALRLDAPDRKPLGVILVESTDVTMYKENKIKESLTEQKEYISNFIQTWIDYIPSLSEAQSKGL